MLEEYQHRIQQGFEQVQSCVLQIEQSQRMISQMKSEQSSCDSQIAVAQNDLSHNENRLKKLTLRFCPIPKTRMKPKQIKG